MTAILDFDSRLCENIGVPFSALWAFAEIIFTYFALQDLHKTNHVLRSDRGCGKKKQIPFQIGLTDSVYWIILSSIASERSG